VDLVSEITVDELKQERLKQILPTGRGVWIPIDHGASDWPVSGLSDVGSLVSKLTSSRGPDAILFHIINQILEKIGVVDGFSTFQYLLDMEGKNQISKC